MIKILLNFWVFGDDRYDFFGYGGDSDIYEIHKNEELVYRSDFGREPCYAYMLNAIEEEYNARF